MFITLRKRVTVQDNYDVVVTSVISDKNTFVITDESSRTRFWGNIASKRYCVIRIIVQVINGEGLNEYHVYDCHGDHFVVVDLDNNNIPDHKLVKWMEAIDCNIRSGQNRKLREIRVYSNRANQNDYTLLDIDEEQRSFHTRIKPTLDKYFSKQLTF